MSYKTQYLLSDAPLEIITKNKENIIDLSDQITKLQESSETSFKQLTDLLGNYGQDVENDLDENKSVIENLSIVASNLKAEIARLNAIESRVTIIENDGIGNYIGTYRSKANDDSSTLPVPAQDKDRAITEYLVGDELKYQEWVFNTLKWTKMGDELDSHIHSQSAGITLADVAKQQDPKMFLRTDYEEKEITITPAIYGWVEIKDYDTKQYTQDDIGKKVRITYDSGFASGLISASDDTKLPKINIHLGVASTDPTDQNQHFYSSEYPTKLGLIKLQSTPSISIFESLISISKFEIWDIITPSVKAIALVKK